MFAWKPCGNAMVAGGVSGGQTEHSCPRQTPGECLLLSTLMGSADPRFLRAYLGAWAKPVPTSAEQHLWTSVETGTKTICVPESLIFPVAGH